MVPSSRSSAFAFGWRADRKGYDRQRPGALVVGKTSPSNLEVTGKASVGIHSGSLASRHWWGCGHQAGSVISKGEGRVSGIGYNKLFGAGFRSRREWK